jgi:hypothetical protein
MRGSLGIISGAFALRSRAFALRNACFFDSFHARTNLPHENYLSGFFNQSLRRL